MVSLTEPASLAVDASRTVQEEELPDMCTWHESFAELLPRVRHAVRLKADLLMVGASATRGQVLGRGLAQ